mmetsp:Transcript_35835/g.91540  ORF Transcript_35835/g.91540 Transcript_35835/m.91540 type:complete len:290 (+) Transcript_35835:401-1270(+)
MPAAVVDRLPRRAAGVGNADREPLGVANAEGVGLRAHAVREGDSHIVCRRLEPEGHRQARAGHPRKGRKLDIPALLRRPVGPKLERLGLRPRPRGLERDGGGVAGGVDVRDDPRVLIRRRHLRRLVNVLDLAVALFEEELLLRAVRLDDSHHALALQEVPVAVPDRVQLVPAVDWLLDRDRLRPALDRPRPRVVAVESRQAPPHGARLAGIPHFAAPGHVEREVHVADHVPVPRQDVGRGAGNHGGGEEDAIAVDGTRQHVHVKGCRRVPLLAHRDRERPRGTRDPVRP